MKAPCVFIIFLFALALRLYPTLVSDMPFSTDAWSPIKNAELLVAYTPIDIGNQTVFDGYNNYWPANSIFGAVMSQVTGLPPINVLATYMPLVGAVAILIFYVVARNLFNTDVSFIASLVFATAFTHAYFTAGVTKETYANPLYFTLILTFLNERLTKRKGVIVAFAFTSVALALAHHLTAAIAIIILVAMTLFHQIEKFKGKSAKNRPSLQLTAVLAVTVALYFLLYAHKGFKYALAPSDIISVASHQAVMFTLATYLAFKPYTPKRARTAVVVLTFSLMAAALLVTNLYAQIMPSFTQNVQRHVLIYILPYYLAAPFLYLGYQHQKRMEGSYEPLIWLLTILGLESYAMFSDPIKTEALWLRTPNFLYPPLALFLAAGLIYTFSTRGKFPLHRFFKPMAVAILAAIIYLNVYSLYAAVNLQDRYMGYHWLYRKEEFAGVSWLSSHSNQTTVAGDVKIQYMARDYFKLKTDVIGGYQYLSGKSRNKPETLFIYHQMYKNGYVLGYHGIDLPENWTENLNQLNLLYSNKQSTIHSW
ncbi:MAG: hypothetical protein QXL77_08100 [Candidatus Bathyarchaeia archaeon]